MQRRHSSWLTTLFMAVALGGAACLTAVAQLDLRVGRIDARAPGTYRGTSRTIRYGSSYVSDRLGSHSRRLPSESRGARLRDGYLPSQNRGYRLAAGPLPVSGRRYVGPARWSRRSISPARASLRYASAPPARLSPTRSASLRYAGGRSWSGSNLARSRSGLSSLGRSPLPKAMSTRTVSAGTHRSMGTIRYGGADRQVALGSRRLPGIDDFRVDRPKPIGPPLSPRLPSETTRKEEGVVVKMPDATKSPIPVQDAPAPASVRGPRGLMGLYRLPGNHVEFSLNGRTYYRVGFTCYKPYAHDGGTFYVAISPPYGTVFPALPPDCQAVTVGSQTYHRDGTVYYRTVTSGDKKQYIVVEPPAGAAPPPGGLNPIRLLQRMSDCLSKARQFSFQATDTMEQGLESGSKATPSAQRVVHVSRPDKMLVDVKGDGVDRGIWYDGKTLTVLDRKRNTYAVADVPNTIDAMLDDIAKRYAATVPLSDLVRSSAYKALMADTKAEAAHYVGKAKAAEAVCHHLAFEGGRIDWQIWIDAGDPPLPRRLMFRYKQQIGHRVYTAMLGKWNLSPTLSEKQFISKAPAGAERVPMSTLMRDGGGTATNASR